MHSGDDALVQIKWNTMDSVRLSNTMECMECITLPLSSIEHVLILSVLLCKFQILTFAAVFFRQRWHDVQTEMLRQNRQTWKNI